MIRWHFHFLGQTRTLASQIPVGVIGKIDHRWLCCCCLKIKGQNVIDKTVGSTHVHCTGIALITIGRMLAEAQALVDFGHIPHGIAKVHRSAVQMIGTLIRSEMNLFAVKGKF